VSGASGSKAIELCGRLTGGLTSIHTGVGASAFVVWKTCPEWPGVEALNPDNVANATFGSTGSKSRSVTGRAGRLAVGSRSVHAPPPVVVSIT
jgi:hypothetical protein